VGGDVMKPHPITYTPHFLLRPRVNEMTRKEKITAGQARSLLRRKVKVTLPKSPWEKNQ
jgi:hypothetical protein